MANDQKDEFSKVDPMLGVDINDSTDEPKQDLHTPPQADSDQGLETIHSQANETGGKDIVQKGLLSKGEARQSRASSENTMPDPYEQQV